MYDATHLELAEYGGTLNEDRIKLMIRDVVDESVNALEARMRTHFDERFDTMQRMFTAAFPNGDPHGHRLRHEDDIRNSDHWTHLRQEVMLKLVSAVLMFGLGWGAAALWTAFREGIIK